MRMNALALIASDEGLLRALREAPLLRSPLLGVLSLRNLRIASGRQRLPEGSEESPPTPEQIEAILASAGTDDLSAMSAVLGRCVAAQQAIDRLLGEQAPNQAPDLEPLATDLYEAVRVIERGQARHASATGDADANVAGPAASPGAGAGTPGGPVRSRADVVRTLDTIIAYYQAQEPSSPLPMLLERAKRLVHKNFREIIAELAPGGEAEIQVLAGRDESG